MTYDASQATVVKVGGSLFCRSDFQQKLSRWVNRQSRPLVLIAGGGGLTDEVRDWQRIHGIHGINDEIAHEMCLRLMSVSARLLAQLLPQARLTAGPATTLQALSAGQRLTVMQVDWLVSTTEAAPSELPRNWSVTSDSVAAYVARRIGTGTLVLLKSALPEQSNRRWASASGYVDAHFAAISQFLDDVTCVDLGGGGQRRLD